MSDSDLLVRIKPDCPREIHVIDGRRFERRAGWCGPVTDAELADRLRSEPLHDTPSLRNHGPKVFDVATRAEARAQSLREAKQAEERRRADAESRRSIDTATVPGTIDVPQAVPGQRAG